MNIKPITECFKCTQCKGAFVGDGYELFDHSLCLACLNVLHSSIGHVLYDIQQTEREKNNAIMVPLLEKVLEDVKSMTTEEYLEFIAKCPPMDKEWRDYTGGWDDND